MSMAIKKENENFIAKRSCFMHNYLCYQRLVPYSIATETYHLIETHHLLFFGLSLNETHHLLFFGETAKEPDDFDGQLGSTVSVRLLSYLNF